MKVRLSFHEAVSLVKFAEEKELIKKNEIFTPKIISKSYREELEYLAARRAVKQFINWVNIITDKKNPVINTISEFSNNIIND